MLDVRRLRLLRELSLRGTIAAVADALAYTPSAVSQQLGVLEREAGTRLLERTGRRVTLTPAAHKLVAHAEAVLERLEQAEGELAASRDRVAGQVRIGIFPTAARVILPDALASLAARHPDLEPMVSEIDPADVAPALRAGELDLALVHEYDFVPSPVEPALATEPLCDEAMYLATTTSAPAPAGGATVLGHWRDAPWITATPGTLCYAMALRACQAAGFTPHVRHHVDEFATVLALVAAGQGVAMVPHLAVINMPPSVTLVRLPLHRRALIAFRSGAHGHPAIAAIASALRAAVPAQPESVESVLG